MSQWVVSAKTNSASAAKWVREAKRSASGMTKDGVQRTIKEGYIIIARLLNGRRDVAVLDLPVALYLPNTRITRIEGDETVFPNVRIAPTRDLFIPGSTTSGRTVEVFSGEGVSDRTGDTGEAFFGGAPPLAARNTIARGDRGYTGSGAARGGYTFNTDEPNPTRPIPDTYPWWAAVYAQTVKAKGVVRIGFTEAFVKTNTGGFGFFPRAVTAGFYRESWPIPACDRRVTLAGEDRTAMALPVASDEGAWNSTTNNNNFGYGGLYLAAVSTSGDTVQLLRTTLLATQDFSSGPFFVPLWEGAGGNNGLMPNRWVGDVAMTEDGSLFWGGVYETSRQIESFSSRIGVRSLVAILLPPNAAPIDAQVVSTSVFVDAANDTADNHLALDTDRANSLVPYVENVQCFAPLGLDPFFVGEMTWVTRVSVDGGSSATVAASASASIAVGRLGGLQIFAVPDGAFSEPGTSINIVTEATTDRATIALVDANKISPKIGFVIRKEADFTTLKYMELDLTTGVFTLRGVVGTVGVGLFDAPPAMTCYQRMESAQVAGANKELRPAGLLLTYSIGGQESTKISKDSGKTWQDVARLAARTAPYYLGSGLTGFALDQMYYEVNDDG